MNEDELVKKLTDYSGILSILNKLKKDGFLGMINTLFNEIYM